MEYDDLIKAIKEAKSNLDNATSGPEIIYFSSQLLMLEDKLENIINKGK